MTVLEKYNRYLAEPSLSDEYREQLKHLTSEEINDAFYRDLEFGTAGMRGLLGPGSNRLNIYVIRKATVGFSLYLLSKFGARAKTNGVVISHDNRLYSREFAIETARTLSSYGIKAHLFDSLRPTPELSYAVRKSKAVGGIMITASHNPKEYNGYKVYDKNGEEAAEKVLIKYYSSKVEESLFFLKNNCEELLVRYNLILKAFEDHKEGRYYASVPLFLMIIDGAVNDYAKSKGFFAEGTDVSAWDCLVGCSSGLSKIKNIYCKGRKKY